MTKSYMKWIDITKFIAITLMIIGHTITNHNLLVFIYSFHMPLFIILSGISCKKPDKITDVKKGLKNRKVGL